MYWLNDALWIIELDGEIAIADDPLLAGLAQLEGYLDGLGLPTGWLVIFDERPEAEPTSVRTRRALARSPAGREITVIDA